MTLVAQLALRVLLIKFSKFEIGFFCLSQHLQLLQLSRYLDPNGKARSIDCFFQSGPNKGLSKGLDVIAKELGIARPEKFKLPALRDHLSTHPAFQNVGVSQYSAIFQKFTILFAFHRSLVSNFLRKSTT